MEGESTRSALRRRGLAQHAFASLIAGVRDKARFWIDFEVTPGRPKHRILIEFYALRDARGRYLGCMECTQNVQDIMELKGQKGCWTELWSGSGPCDPLRRRFR